MGALSGFTVGPDAAPGQAPAPTGGSGALKGFDIGASVPAAPAAPAPSASPFKEASQPNMPLSQPFQAVKPVAQAGKAIRTAFAPVMTPGTDQPEAAQPTLPKQIMADVDNIWQAPPSQKTPVTPQRYLAAIYGTKTPDGIEGGILGDSAKAWKDFYDQTTADMKTLADNPGTDEATRVAMSGQGALSALNAFFAPVTTVFSQAATVPGPVGQTADFINRMFSSVGAAGGDTLDAMLKASPLSDKQKETLSPVVKQIGSLAAQIASGEAVHGTFGDLKAATHEFVGKVMEDPNLKTLNDNPGMVADARGQQATQASRAAQAKPVAEQTPGDVHAQIADHFANQEKEAAPLKSAVDEAQKAVEGAKSGSQEKKEAKIQLSQAKEALQAKQAEHVSSTFQGLADLHGMLAEHVQAAHPEFSPEDADAVAHGVLNHVTNPDLATSHADVPFADIAEKVASEHVPAPAVEKPAESPEPAPKPEDRVIASLRSSGHDWDGMIEGGDVARAQVYNEDGTLTPDRAAHTVSDLAGKLDMLVGKEAGDAFRKAVDLSKPTPENLISQAEKFAKRPKEKPAEPKPEKKAPARRTGVLKETKGTGKAKGYGLGERIEANAVEKGPSESFGNDVPLRQQVNLKEQAEKIADLVGKKPAEEIEQMALGNKPTPEGIIPEMLANFVEKRALENGDTDMLRKMAGSTLTKQASEYGLRLRALGERDNASAVDAIKKIQEARAAAAQAKGTDVEAEKKSDVKRIRSEIKSSRAPRQSWKEFANQIACNI